MVDALTADSGNTIMPDGLGDSAAAQPEGVTSQADSPEGTQPDGDKTQKRVEDTSEALKEVQRQYHSLAQQKRELETAVAELKGQVGVLASQSASTKPEEPDWLESQEWKTRFEDDPYTAMHEMIRQHRKEVAEYVDLSRQDLIAQSSAAIRQATDPTRAELRAELEALSEVKGFTSMTPEDQLALAQKLRESKPAEGIRAPGASPAGNGRSEPVAKRETAAEKDQRIRSGANYQKFGKMPGEVVDAEIVPIDGI